MKYLHLIRIRRGVPIAALGLAAALGGAAVGQDTAADAFAALRPQGQVVGSVATSPSDAIVLRNRSNVEIKALRIRGDVSITLENCQNITVVSCDLRSIRAAGCTGLRIYNNHLSDSTNNGVHLDGCEDVVVQGNRIESVASGVYAHRSTKVQVVGNLCIDVQGPFPRGQLAQFDQVTGPDNLIMGNVGVNHHGRSRAEDMINLFRSEGTARSPIRVEHNHLSGDPDRGSEDFSKSGSGIILGDGGGRYQLCVNNTLVSPGQVGIGVASGGDIWVSSNTVVGEISNVANVGIYTWNQYPDTEAGAVTVTRNRVEWTNADRRSNPYWNGGGFTRVTRSDNVFGDPELSPDDLPAPLRGDVPPLPFGDRAQYPLPAE